MKPKIAGFTIVRNAINFDYPVVESIESILPVVDEMVVAVGQSNDKTLELIQKIPSPKIRIIETLWDDRLRVGGEVLAVETNKAMDAISPDMDWCFYIQADEVFHESGLEKMKSALTHYHQDQKVEGLLVKYTHFYGSHRYVGDSRSWYRNEIRVIRNNPAIRSYKDAQGFRIHGRKLRVAQSGCDMYHYGWVKDPKISKKKEKSMHRFWHSDEWIKANVNDVEEYDYYAVDSLKLFTGEHPAIMKQRIELENWNFNFDTRVKRFNTKKWILYFVEKWTGWRPFEYKNYKLIY